MSHTQPGDLSKLDVDDLMNVEVTSVARRAQKLADTPAAVFVITHDDIQRSGATTIAEVLRMAPGLDVASIDGNIWAISVRGFNDRWSNKTLVLIDGRSAYSPLFSGVYWDIQDTNLDDVDRIEVIRGPGGTLWGTNGANGVINIITRNAIETHGVAATVGGGTAERSFASVRYGSNAGDDFHFRVFAKTYDRDPGQRDAWSGVRGGFRADWLASPRDTVMVQSNLYRGSTNESVDMFSPADPLHGPWHFTNRPLGGDVTMKWTQTQSTRSETTLQIYGDYAARLDSSLLERRRAYDIDFQHRFSAGVHNELVWGVGFRRDSAHADSPGGWIEFQNPSESENVISGFVRDEIGLPHNLRITLGSKMQYETDTNVMFQPTLRALWHPDEQQAVWAAITRAIRAPGWIEQSATINLSASSAPDGELTEVVLYPNHKVGQEKEDTLEIGYRRQWTDRFSIDATAFRERLSDVINSEADGAPQFDAEAHRVVIPLGWRNDDDGHAFGLEIYGTGHLTDRWDVTAGYSWLHLHNLNHTADDDLLFGSSPKHQIQLRNQFILTPRLELDASAYYVGHLEAQDVPAYVRVDARLAWHPTAALVLSIVGQNLFDDRHLEFAGNQAVTATPIRRSVYGKATWRF